MAETMRAIETMARDDKAKDAAAGDLSNDGIDRRGFLKCMAWAGTGVLWKFQGGVPVSRMLGRAMEGRTGEDFSFVQISDSHIGFNKAANADVTGTLQAALDRIDGAEVSPDFVIHTGDLTHSSKAAEFDLLDQKMGSKRHVFYVPGEHDTAVDDGKIYLQRYGKGTKGRGWYSFNHKGVHFVGLNNVLQLEGMGKLGWEQVEWLKRDLESLKASQPVVVFAHIPLWSIYPDWGWATEDSQQAMALLKRFGSVTVLNGHIHQVMQKVEGTVSFHTAMSTAFPQPAPGEAASPGPIKVPAERLKQVLGITKVNFVAQKHDLALVDTALEG